MNDNMLFDNHIHTKYSADSEMNPVEALRRAQELGVGLVFTEHFDWNFPGDKDFTFDADAYFAEYAPLQGFDLRLGAEIGIADYAAEKNREFVGNAPFDMVIGSLHLLRGVDLYLPEAYEGLTRNEAYTEYFADMAKAVRTQGDNFDVLGHIDYIARCAPYDDKSFVYGDFADLIDAVLLAVIEKDVVLEVNTRRFGERFAVDSLMTVWKRYRELGGKYVTMGSDAHNLETIGKNFAVALSAVEACNLVPVTFAARRLQIIR